jgi:hypothetical protein
VNECNPSGPAIYGLVFGVAVSNPSRGMDVSVCCQVEVSAMGRSLVQRSPTECGVFECDRGTSQRRTRQMRTVEL